MMGGVMMMRRADFSNTSRREKGMPNIAWDTYPEDVVFRNDRKKEIVIDDE